MPRFKSPTPQTIENGENGLNIYLYHLNQPQMARCRKYQSKIEIRYYGRTSKKPGKDSKVSFVCFRIYGNNHPERPKHIDIIMAHSQFSITGTNAKKSNFYEKLNVGTNIDARSIPHGGEKDNREDTLERFEKHADMIYQNENHDGKAILVNCNHGRSRTGSIVALYLMKYHDYDAVDAIARIGAIQSFRNISESIDIKLQGNKGNYSDWLKHWHDQKNLDKQVKDQAAQSQAASSTSSASNANVDVETPNNQSDGYIDFFQTRPIRVRKPPEIYRDDNYKNNKNSFFKYERE